MTSYAKSQQETRLNIQWQKIWHPNPIHKRGVSLAEELLFDLDLETRRLFVRNAFFFLGLSCRLKASIEQRISCNFRSSRSSNPLNSWARVEESPWGRVGGAGEDKSQHSNMILQRQTWLVRMSIWSGSYARVRAHVIYCNPIKC